MVFILYVNNLYYFCRKGDKIHSPADIAVISDLLQSLHVLQKVQFTVAFFKPNKY